MYSIYKFMQMRANPHVLFSFSEAELERALGTPDTGPYRPPTTMDGVIC